MNNLLTTFLLITAIADGLFSSVHSLKVELIHRSAVAGDASAGMDAAEKLKLLHRRDIARREGLIQRRRATEAPAVAVPMHAGADYGTGEYFVHVWVGTPGQKFMLVADTGSELTWMHCRHGAQKGKASTGKAFLADQSRSFKAVPCGSSMCKVDLANLFSLKTCPNAQTPCAYDYRYLEGSGVLGFFANESISVGLNNGKRGRMDILIGCTQAVTNDQGTFKGSDGVLGLGFSNYSFTSKAASAFGKKFSYCLVDHLSSKNESNYIVFGRQNRPATASSPKTLQKTPLVLGIYGPLYGVSLKGISVNRVLAKIPRIAWDPRRGGGAVLDSGSSLTFLPEPAYGPVTAMLTAYTDTLGKLEPEGPFEFCFNENKFNESLMPRLRIHFAGAIFTPPVKSYVLDVAPGKMCLGFIAAAWPSATIIGNILQQNHLWEFDLEHQTLAFGPSTCT